MEAERSKTKVKIIASIVIIAAVVIMYLISSAQDSDSASTSNTSDTATTQSTDTMDTTAGASDTHGSFKDGTYTAQADYRTPEGTEDIGVTLTIKDGVVTDSDVELSANDRQSREYQEIFRNNYEQYVIGRKLSDIQLSRVSGSSLTSSGFNDAVDAIQAEAEA